MRYNRSNTMTARILIVEDESITRANIAEFLRKEGYDVDEARDGAQAVDLCDIRRFDLVITDFLMPAHLNGLELVGRIRLIFPQVPVILVSAYLSSTMAKALLQRPAEFVAKPIELDVLLATVKHLLQLRSNP